MSSRTPVADAYSMANETNPLDYDHGTVEYRNMFLDDLQAEGGKIKRLRLFIERGMVDVSYCHGILPDGTIVSISTSMLSIRNSRTIKADLIEWAKHENAYAKGLGLLDESNWSVLR